MINYYYLTIIYLIYADVAELADAPDLGSGAYGVGVRFPSSAPITYNRRLNLSINAWNNDSYSCLLYTSDAADE